MQYGMIEIDGKPFYVPLEAVGRTADFLDKYAQRTESGDLERELIGVYTNYQLQFLPTTNRAEYARLWDKLTEPVEFHDVVVPGENGAFAFRAYFSGVSDQLLLQRAECTYWSDLKVKFTAKSPARV